MSGSLKPAEIAEQVRHYPHTEHLSDAQVRDLALRFGQVTEFGNVNFISNVRNRSAGVTVCLGSEKVRQRELSSRQRQIAESAADTLHKLHRYLERTPIVSLERTMGENSAFCPQCTVYVTTRVGSAVRLAYMWGETLFPHRPQASGPEMALIYVPEWPEASRQVLVYPEEHVTFVLGSDYMGESKKGFLRMAMWLAKQQGMLGCHAGAKIVQAREAGGKLRRYSMLLFGLSATGKTTHSCHDHGLHGSAEDMWVVQDDVCLLCPDGSALGTERGFYLKTEGLDRHSQPILYDAAIQPDTIFENVAVDVEGRVDLQDETLTSNGRGVVQMVHFAPHIGDGINLPPVDELDGLLLVFITRRNTVLPMVSKLTAEQAALTFMLGESVESSAGDPTRAGESVRVVGTNPFIIGDQAQEGNWIYEFLKSHPGRVQAYLINTGGVGEVRERQADGTFRVKREVVRIQISETSAIFRAVARNAVEWVREPHFGAMVPKEIQGVDMSKFDPGLFYSTSETEELVATLKRERREYIERFEGLDPAIVKAADA
ncbi:MAG: phosphoenolpyruvate carboxykinase [Armatimonadota bacterium]